MTDGSGLDDERVGDVAGPGFVAAGPIDGQPVSVVAHGVSAAYHSSVLSRPAVPGPAIALPKNAAVAMRSSSVNGPSVAVPPELITLHRPDTSTRTHGADEIPCVRVKVGERERGRAVASAKLPMGLAALVGEVAACLGVRPQVGVGRAGDFLPVRGQPARGHR